MTRRRNSAVAVDELAAAEDLSQAWHGRRPKRATEVVEEVTVRHALADLGGLMELEIIDQRRPRYVWPIRFRRDVRVSAALEAGTNEARQLYFVGGDQSIDLGTLGITEEHDKEIVGSVYSITYYTSKHHMDAEDKIPGPYQHRFGEDGGEMPLLVYDCLNHTIELVGGTYHIKLDDFNGGSAGIRN